MISFSNTVLCLKIEKRIQLEIIEEIDTLSQYGTQVHLKCSSQDATIFYTLDGSLPTLRYDYVHVNENSLIDLIA